MRDLSTGHGFVTPSDIDHRPWLWVCSLLALLYSLLCLGARFVGKWDLLWWDDLVLSIGYVFAVVHWGILFSALDSGLAVTALALTADQTGRASEVSISFTYIQQHPGHPMNGRESGVRYRFLLT